MKRDTDKTDAIDTDIQDDLRLAEIARERKRKVAPGILAAGPKLIEQKKLMQQFCPESCGKNPKWHSMFGDADLYKQYINEGYEPVLDKGEPIRFGKSGDILMKIPQDLHEQNLAVAVARDRQRTSEGWNKEKAKNRKNPVAHGERVKMVRPGDDGADSAAGDIPDLDND